MDPARALIEADQALSDLDPPTAVERLNGYASWRFKGGFQPSSQQMLDYGYGKVMGDEVFDRLMTKLADQLSDEYPTKRR